MFAYDVTDGIKPGGQWCLLGLRGFEGLGLSEQSLIGIVIGCTLFPIQETLNPKPCGDRFA